MNARLRQLVSTTRDWVASVRTDQRRDKFLARAWEDDVPSAGDVAVALRAVGAQLQRGPGPEHDTKLAATLIKLCLFFRARGLTRGQMNKALVAAVLQSVAPWTLKRSVQRADRWEQPVEERPRTADLATFGRFLEGNAGALTSGERDSRATEGLLLRMSRNFPTDARLPDSCADEPVDVAELIVRLHTLIDNALDPPARRQRATALVLAGIGFMIGAVSVLSPSEGAGVGPPFFGVAVGLWFGAVAGATFTRTTVIHRLDRWSLATARTTAHALTGIVTIAVAIIGFWTITDQPRIFTVAGLVLLLVMVSASVCAEHAVALGEIRLGELREEEVAAAERGDH